MEWNLPGPRQSLRKVPPTAAETEQASTSVGKDGFVKGEKGSENHQPGAVSKYLSVGVWDTFVHCSTVTSLYLLVYHLCAQSRAPVSAETASLLQYLRQHGCNSFEQFFGNLHFMKLLFLCFCLSFCGITVNTISCTHGDSYG